MRIDLLYIYICCWVLCSMKIFQALGASYKKVSYKNAISNVNWDNTYIRFYNNDRENNEINNYKKQVISQNITLLLRIFNVIVYFLTFDGIRYLIWVFNFFYGNIFYFSRIKVTDIGNRIIGSNQKRLYSTKIEFTKRYKQQINKDLLNKKFNNKNDFIYWRDKFNLIHKHPITINNITRLNNVDCIVEYITNTTKNKDVIIDNNSISVKEVGQNINGKSFQGMPKIVFSKVVKIKDLKNGKILKDDTNFTLSEKISLINNEINIINNESMKKLDLDNLKITNYNGNFSGFQTFVDFLKSLK